jgi:hypothetical protein
VNNPCCCRPQTCTPAPPASEPRIRPVYIRPGRHAASSAVRLERVPQPPVSEYQVLNPSAPVIVPGSPAELAPAGGIKPAARKRCRGRRARGRWLGAVHRDRVRRTARRRYAWPKDECGCHVGVRAAGEDVECAAKPRTAMSYPFEVEQTPSSLQTRGRTLQRLCRQPAQHFFPSGAGYEGSIQALKLWSLLI